MNTPFLDSLYQHHKDCSHCPSRKRSAAFVESLIGLLYPDYEQQSFHSFSDFQSHVARLESDLHDILSRDPAASFDNAKAVASTFFEDLPALQGSIDQDVEAMYDGDPAAKSQAEVIRCYPGFFAIATYRVAHKLLGMGAGLTPRIFTEVAHGQTGIDIHPGAVIDSYFCIDHGTGVVIGETTHIGKHVKIYQGVTLGGLSVDKADASKKRHPTIEDHVVIYAGATILGGKTVVGAHSVIGGNVWLTRSVEPHTKVYYKAAMTTESGDTDIIEFK